MKVCHLTSVHAYNDIRIMIKECKSLYKANYEVHLIAPDTELKQFEGIIIHGINNPYEGRLKRIRNFTKDIYKEALRVNADIYHFHDPELIFIGKLLRKKGKKVIYDVHEDVPRQILTKYWIPKVLRKLVSRSFESYENNAVKKFDAVVTATPHIRNRFLKYNSNTVDINNFPILDELYEDNTKCKKENAVVYVGGITKARGSEVMVKAIGKTNGKLNLAGKFSNESEKNNLKTLKSWDTSVNFFGFLDRNQIKEILQRSCAGLVVLEPRANYLDSLPIKMFEYMSAGIPVIASNFPLWREIIEVNKCGICVDPLNVDEISDGIQWILDNRDKAIEMGRQGRKAVETKFNWENESKKLIKLYGELLS